MILSQIHLLQSRKTKNSKTKKQKLLGSVTFPVLDQQSSQEFNDLFTNLNAYQETISIPPQVAANDPAVPAQIDEQQEEFAENSSGSATGIFATVFARKHFGGSTD